MVNTVRRDDGTSDAGAESNDDDAETGTASQGKEFVCDADVLHWVAKMRAFLNRRNSATAALLKNVKSFELFILQQLSGTRRASITDFFK
ncbi:hypothetical protein HPB48_001724 [Haemaphysalis longicornis]|uniref:Uncharacterized protein n=1 Tax=Haemaphysalis longicornis TaxID=44386 RepID=A0A9J6GWG0_HAELO|nr:hypothetical protein HPB48_001724 [Haemaphysalis longicornis]